MSEKTGSAVRNCVEQSSVGVFLGAIFHQAANQQVHFMSVGAKQDTFECLSDEILKDFVAGKLNDASLKSKVSCHIESCANCGSRLSSLQSKQEKLEAESRNSAEKSSRGDSARPVSSTKSRLNTNDALEETRIDPSSSEECLPAKIEPYLILRELGAGGFARVYLAKDMDRNRFVAIKVPRADRVFTGSHRDTFLNEARTVALMDHPNIVQLYDYQELQDGRCIFVMEYIQGSSLKEVMASGSIDTRQAARIVLRVAKALHYAHQRGVWHRDVKPANILMDSNGTPFLGDFGLAIHEQRQHLHANELAGTYPYMSPEQICGTVEQLDARSDIWSLGVVFYELLTRRRPFAGETLPQLREEISQRPHQPLRRFDSKIPTRLVKICDNCLRKKASERYDTAALLAGDIESYLRKRWEAVALSSITVLGLISFPMLQNSGELENSTAPEAKQEDSKKEDINPKGVEPQKRELKPLVWPTLAKDDFYQEDINPNGVAPQKRLLKPLVWPTLAKDDFYQEEQPGGRFVVKSTACLSCFETNRPMTEHYRIHSSANLQNQRASAGIMLGYHKTSLSPEAYRCWIVYVHKAVGREGLWLTIKDCRVQMNNFGRLDFDEFKELAGILVDDEFRDHFDLEIRVDSEKISSIKYADRAIEEETLEMLNHVNIPDKTSCGVVAAGHVVFQSIDFEELTR